jgi:hypothetical protein
MEISKEDLQDEKLYGIIIIREFEDGSIDWQSSYDDADEFFEVLQIVYEEAQEPEVEIFQYINRSNK